MSDQQQFLRKANLVVLPSNPNLTAIGDLPLGDFEVEGLDLSELRFRFKAMQGDTESPNNLEVRVHNASPDTMKRIQEKFRYVVVQAGYENGTYGVIFEGDIKQYRVGRENATDTYLDILAADGDFGYNWGTIKQAFASGSSPRDSILAAAKAMSLKIDPSRFPDLNSPQAANPALARSKVGFGMARDLMREAVQSIGCTWSIQNGTVQILPLQGYLPGEAVVLNAATGMIGIPEQTELGIEVRSLLNPNLQVGGLVKLNSGDINKLIQRDFFNSPMPFNQRTGIQFASKIAEGADGLYRIYVANHRGDTRGNEWFTDLTCLAINQPGKEVELKN